MLGEKRSQSLFAPKASAEKAAATHITTGPDGRKKELPLYFGPDCPVSGNMGQNQHEAGVGEPQPADEPLRHAPADDGTGVEADPTDSVNMAEDLPRRSLNTESAGGYRAHSLFFTPENEGQDFNTVLQDVQEYISGKYSALITEGGDEDAKAQIKRYITKYVQDRRIAVKGYSGDQLVDALYTEMAEFGLLTKYIFGTGIEEINVNSWRDIEVLYANGETVKLEEHFDSPEHAVNVIRRMLHVSGMVLDNASPAVLGHLSKNIRIAVLKTPLVDEDVGVTASIRIVNPQNMQKEDFVKGGTATGPMLDFLAACLRYGVSVCVAGATGSGKTTVAGWLLTTIPDNKRIFTIENGSRELDLVREKDGRVCNSVIHTITRESENAKQNIDQDMLLDMALRYHPDIICVGEMRSAEAYAAQEAARTGHGVLTTIHSNSSQATLIGPQDTEDGSEVCTLPGGEEVNFYQVIPLYEDELDYKLEHDTDALLNKMRGISFVVNPTRQDAITRGTLSNDDFDGEMDDASYHIESIEEKELPIDPINAYNHMAIYLRWCMEHDLMGEDFLKEYSEVAKQVKADPASVDLREFIRDELDGCLFSVLFNHQGRAFAGYYYGEGDSPYYPADVDDNALCFFGPERYHSDEFQDEAYLFIPFDEDYYQAMAEVIEERFANWQGQDFDEDTLEPSEVAQAIMEYLDCECTYFPSMADDDPIMSAYSYAQRLGVREGFVPVLIQADDETLLECLVMNADPKNDVDIYEFDLKAVTEYRKKMLSTPVKDGKTVLEELTGQRKEEAEDDDMDWDEEVLGEMEGGEPNDRFSSYWDDDTEMTYPLILAKIPVKNPWEIFAYLPFGNWNDCPDTPELMAAAKYWFQQHGAIPAAMSHDELEFELPTPISKERAMEVAVEQYGFCPDLDQNEDGSIGSLADVLWQSTVWYFWWD